MLRLLLGRAGSGKTHRILRELEKRASEEEQASRCVLLVPEQFSFETERALLRDLGIRAAFDVKVYSFTRLSEMVAKEMGGVAGRQMNEGTRVLLMSEALGQVADRLTVYRCRGGVEAQVEAMLQFAEECKQGGISPDRLELAASEATEEVLKKKLEDLSLVMGAYEALTAQSYIDPKDALATLCEQLPQSDLLRGKYVFIDGFKGFTAQELRVLGEIMEVAAEVTVTLCTDTLQEEDAATQLLYTPTHTAAQLMRMARERGMKIAPTCYLTENYRHGAAPALRCLESGLLRPERETFEQETEEVTVTPCDTIYRECEYAVRTMRRLMREEGLRCRDMAVVVRSAEQYRGILDTVLEKAEIPYYMDTREKILNDTLTVGVLSALRCVCDGFRAEDVLRLVKTGLLGFSARSTALLENYAYMWNIQGARWKQPWREHPDGLSVTADEDSDRRLHYLELLRRRIMRPLEKLEGSLKGHPTGETFARAVYTYLKETRAARMVRLQVARLDRDGEVALADRAARVWDVMMDVLDVFATALKYTTGSAAHFTELLRQVAGATDLGSIPQQLDAVQIGAADRIRFSSPRVVWILGANEGVFPAVPTTTGVLSDRDRQTLKAMELPLADTAEEQLAEERFFLYAAATAPSERLYVSYLLGNTAGETLSPSILVQEIRELIPRHRRGEERRRDTRDLEYAEEAFSRMAEDWRDPVGTAQTLYEALKTEPEFFARTKLLERASKREPMHFENAAVAKKLFGKDMTLSATRVDTFYQCRFRYFCRYGMRAMPPKKADLNALEFGNVLHYVMQNCLPSYVEAGMASVTRERTDADARRCILQYVEELMGGTEQKSARFLYLLDRMAQLGGRLLWQVTCELKQSRFVPVDYELPLTRGDEGLPAVRLTLPDGGNVCVIGTIDRVDVYHSGDTAYVRVVDYKTGAKEFRLDEVVEGLNLQMLIYMSTVWQNGGERYGSVTPAGMLYLPSKLPVLEAKAGMDAETREREQLRVMKMNGLLLDNAEVLEAMEPSLAGVFIPVKKKKNGEPDAQSSIASLRQMGLLKKRAEKLLTEMAEILRRGEIAAVPTLSHDHSACDFCDYRTVCGYEEGDDVRQILSASLKDVLKDLEEKTS